MFDKTDNLYSFKYLTSSISGEGITHVYLPKKPINSLIHDFNGKWDRTLLPKEWDKWRKEEAKFLETDPDYIHPFIEPFVSQEWDRRMNGFWFWNTVNGVKEATYITGLHYFYLCWWVTYFDNPSFRDTDKEIFYVLQRNDEDPKCFGSLLGTIRRYGKSAILGCWMLESITRERKRNAGMQGETDKKISEFYLENILYPFRKLPDFFTPIYNESSTLKSGIEFSPTIARGKNQKATIKTETLDSKINYGASDVNYYNRAKLYRYGGEESGKVKEVDVYLRHKKVKPCMQIGIKIYGKMFYATTADEESEKVARFEDMFYHSDFDDKGIDGQTKSGLYAIFLPAQYALLDFIDENGIPESAKADEWLMADRDKFKDYPADLITLIRQYPRSIAEYFYTDAKNCQFNVKILQERKNDLILNKYITTKANFSWLNGKRNSAKVSCDTDVNGKFDVYYLPEDIGDCNLIRQIGAIDGVIQYEPLNTSKYVIGCDPIEWGKTVGGKRSKPAAYVIRKYDISVDGNYTDEEFRDLASKKYAFKTGFPIIRYAYRPDDPKVFYEYIVRLAIYFGCQVHIEQQKAAGLMQYMEANGYSAFIMQRPEITFTSQYSNRQIDTPGTPASRGLTNLFTGLIATNVQVFGHRYPFVKLVEDLLGFEPDNTTIYDDTVAFGFGLMGSEKIEKPKNVQIDLGQIFQLYDNRGNQSIVL